MLDEYGRVWMTEPIRPPGAENNPKWAASTIATDTNDPAAHDIAAKALLSRSHGMQLGYYDTKTNKFVGVDTSYNTHHLQFDWQGRIWTDGDVLGRTGHDQNRSEQIRKGLKQALSRPGCASTWTPRKWFPTNGLRNGCQPDRRHRVAIRSGSEWPGRTSCTCSIQRRANSRITRCLLPGTFPARH